MYGHYREDHVPYIRVSRFSYLVFMLHWHQYGVKFVILCQFSRESQSLLPHFVLPIDTILNWHHFVWLMLAISHLIGDCPMKLFLSRDINCVLLSELSGSFCGLVGGVTSGGIRFSGIKIFNGYLSTNLLIMDCVFLQIYRLFQSGLSNEGVRFAHKLMGKVWFYKPLDVHSVITPCCWDYDVTKKIFLLCVIGRGDGHHLP